MKLFLFKRLLPLFFLLSALPALSASEAISLIPDSTTADEPVTVTTEYYNLTIESEGAKISSFDHLDSEDPLKDRISLVEPDDPFPFQVYTSPRMNHAGTLPTLTKAAYRLSKEEAEDSITVIAAADFTLLQGDKKIPVTLQKRFIFFRDIHYWRFEWRVINRGRDPVEMQRIFFNPVTFIGPESNDESPRSAQAYYNFYHIEDDLEILYKGGGIMGCSGSDEVVRLNKPINFFGNSSRFMVMAVQPLNGSNGAIYFPEVIRGEKTVAHPQIHFKVPPMAVEAGSEKTVAFLVYTGPKVKEFVNTGITALKKYAVLKQVHSDMYQAFDFGFTAPIRDLIVVILNFFYQFIPNYGVGIIIFALLFKLVFFPLNQKQARSMKKMQALQPLMKEINEKYKDNPQEKQKRTMMLYKEHKVNPLGGCLPMLVQIPIFIALYSAFSDAYQLWKAPFIPGWINDLSEPDVIFSLPESWALIGGFTLHLLPLLMAASQFFQTKMTMVSGDDNQKKIMQFMPLIMLFFFWSMPSGVVLYWTIQNILSIGQQYYTNMSKTENAK